MHGLIPHILLYIVTKTLHVFQKKKRNGQVHHQKEDSSYSPLQKFPLPITPPCRNSPVNVRSCGDAFKGRFREGVCIHILAGLVRVDFCHCCVGACSLVYKVWIVSIIYSQSKLCTKIAFIIL